MKDRVLITGGSGFIGSNLIKFLSEKDNIELLNIDCVYNKSIDDLCRTEIVDMLNAQLLSEIIKIFSPHYIVHLAARTDLKGNCKEDYSVNTLGTSNLINAANKTDSVKKIIFCSSMLVCKAGYIPKSDTDYSPDNAYGESKVEMEKIIRREPQPWKWSIIRPTSIWGPGFKEPYRNFFDTVAKGRFVDIGNRYCTKTYGYIGNTVYQIKKILDSDLTNGKTYYLGDDPPIFISEWGKEIAREMKIKDPVKISYSFLKYAAFLGDLLVKAGWQFPMTSFRLKNMTTDNIFDLEELYKIAPNPPFTREEGIKETLNWLRTNK